MSSNQFGESVKQEVFEGESALVHVDAEDDDEENMKDMEGSKDEGLNDHLLENNEKNIVINISPNPVDVIEKVEEIKKAILRFPKNVALVQEAMRALSQLSKESRNHVACAVDEHLVKEVLIVIQNNKWNRNLRLYSAQSLCALSAYDFGTKISLKAEGGVNELIELMDCDYDDFETLQYACEALARFAAHSDNRSHIVEAGGLHAIVNAMTRNLGQAQLIEGGCHALMEISKLEITHAHIRNEGGIAAIISGLGACRGETNAELFQMGMKALHTIAADRQSRIKIGSSGGIGMIIESLSLFRHDRDVVEHGIRAAHYNCNNVSQNTLKFVDNGGIGSILTGMALNSGDGIVCEVGCSAMQHFAGKNEEGKLSIMENAVYELIGVLCDEAEDCQDQPSAIAAVCTTTELISSDLRFVLPILESGLVSLLVKGLILLREHPCAQEAGMRAFQSIACMGLECRQQCREDGVIDAILQGMQLHRDNLSIMQASAQALATFGQEFTAMEKIVSNGGAAVCLEAIDQFPQDHQLASNVSSAIANFAEAAIANDVDKKNWLPMHRSLVNEQAFPRLIGRMAAFPDDIQVQQDACHALHTLCTHRGNAGILTGHNGIEAAIGAIASVCFEEEDGTDVPKAFYSDGQQVQGGPPQSLLQKVKKKLKKGAPKALLLQHALGILVRIGFVSESSRRAIVGNNGVAAVCAAMEIAGSNQQVHHYGSFLLGILCSDNKACQETVFEEEGTERIIESLKRYPSDKEVQLHCLWAACSTCNGHASNQTSYALEGGYDLARKAIGRFSNMKEKEGPYIVYWAQQLIAAIDGNGIKCSESPMFKTEYKNDSEEDEDWGSGVPDEKAEDIVPGIVAVILETFENSCLTRESAATYLQSVLRGCMIRAKFPRPKHALERTHSVPKQNKNRGKGGKQKSKSPAKKGKRKQTTGKKGKKEKAGVGKKVSTEKKAEKKKRTDKKTEKKKSGKIG